MNDRNGDALRPGDLVLAVYRVRECLPEGEVILADEHGTLYGLKANRISKILPPKIFSGTLTPGGGPNGTHARGAVAAHTTR